MTSFLDFAGLCQKVEATSGSLDKIDLVAAFLGSLEEAAEHLATAIKLNPSMAPAHNNLGMILADLGHLDEAVAHFKRALEIDPDYKNARLNLQESLEKQKQSRTTPQ